MMLRFLRSWRSNLSRRSRKEHNHHEDSVYEEGLEEGSVVIEKGGYCINGFRGLVPSQFPSPGNLKFVESQMASVCKCEDCM
jgi:hypothetical protein